MCFIFLLLFFIGPTNVTLYPGPLSYVRWLWRRSRHTTVVSPSYAFSSLSLISSETEGICLLLFALGLCKGSLAGEHAYDF